MSHICNIMSRTWRVAKRTSACFQSGIIPLITAQEIMWDYFSLLWELLINAQGITWNSPEDISLFPQRYNPTHYCTGDYMRLFLMTVRILLINGHGITCDYLEDINLFPQWHNPTHTALGSIWHYFRLPLHCYTLITAQGNKWDYFLEKDYVRLFPIHFWIGLSF